MINEDLVDNTPITIYIIGYSLTEPFFFCLD